MTCARCYNVIKPCNVMMALLPRGTMLVPTCSDDRNCIDRREMAWIKKNIKVVSKVKKLARRFIV